MTAAWGGNPEVGRAAIDVVLTSVVAAAAAAASSSSLESLESGSLELLFAFCCFGWCFVCLSASGTSVLLSSVECWLDGE